MDWLHQTNFAFSTLASQLAIGGTSLVMATGEGNKFPHAATADHFQMVIWGSDYADPSQDTTAEIVHAHYASADTYTITRAQESTSAKQWEVGDKCALVLTAKCLGDIQSALDSVGAGHITIIPWVPYAIVQGTWTVVVMSGSLMNGHAYNSSHANGDECNFKVYLAAGTYTLKALFNTSNNYAIAELLLDGASLGTQDMYTSGTTFNTTWAIYDIVVTSPGMKTLSWKVNGRHASSSDWYVVFSSITLFRTA